MTTSMLLVGVGGQGTILTSKIISEGLVQIGHDVKMSEIHGMAQRGGSVTTQIKYGSEVYSPIIGTAEADVLVAFEKAEAVRYLHQLKPNGKLIINDYEIYPLPVLMGKEEYPQNINEKIKNVVENVKIFNAFKIAEELGNSKAQNIVLLGAIIKALGLDKVDWIEIMKQFIPVKLHELNIKALQAGLNI